jgi:hypothetical protein
MGLENLKYDHVSGPKKARNPLGIIVAILLAGAFTLFFLQYM